MNKISHRAGGLLLAVLLWGCTALPVLAAGSAVRYEAVPDKTAISTGDTLALSIRCVEADLDPAACALTFQIGEGYVFTGASAGTAISADELSYSYQDGQLTLLYLDGAGGRSPVAPGGEIATITLQASEESDGEPVVCTKVDSSAVDAQENVVSQEGRLDVGTVAVTGESVSLPTAAPVLVEGGEATDLADEASGPASPQAKDESSATPAPTPYYTTMPNGERVEIFPMESEPIDRTESVLSGQPATVPTPSGSGSPADAQAASTQDAASVPVTLVIVAAVAVAVLLAAAVLWKKKSH